MTIQVASGVVRRIRTEPDNITIMVKGAEDQEAALRGLRSASSEIAQLDGGWESAPGLRPGDRNGPKYVSDVLPTAIGPMVTIDGGSTPRRVLTTIPDIIVRHLELAGVTEATVASPRGGGKLTNMFWTNGGLPRAVTLGLYPPPPSRWGEEVSIPDEWLVEGARWITEGLADGAELHCSVTAAEFPIAARDSLPFLRQARLSAGSNYQIVSGQLRKRIHRTALEHRGWLPALSFGAGGPAATDEALLTDFEALVAIARQLAPKVGYAFVSQDPRFDGICAATPWIDTRSFPWEWPDQIGYAIDEYVIEALPYQILSPGHVARLGTDVPSLRPLGDGRSELFIGKPDDWLLTAPTEGQSFLDGVEARRHDPHIQEHARELLAPCLLRRGEAARLGLREARLGPHPSQLHIQHQGQSTSTEGEA